MKMKSDNEWKPISEKPEDYKLLFLKTNTDKIVPGWWSGIGWYGRKLKETDEVIEWKVNHDTW